MDDKKVRAPRSQDDNKRDGLLRIWMIKSMAPRSLDDNNKRWSPWFPENMDEKKVGAQGLKESG
jgi:hypothetical protein